MDTLYKQLKTFGHTRAGAPLSKFSTFQIGGPAKFLVEITQTEKLIDLLNFLRAEDQEYFILGGGSNLLLPDEEIDKIVIKIETGNLKLETGEIFADSGVILAKIVFLATQNSLAGIEWGAGIPGTTGGAVRGNAGAYGGSTSDNLESVQVYRDGEVIELKKDECEFGYRESVFKHNSDIVLSAKFGFTLGDKTEILKKTQEYIAERTRKFPRFPSAGSFFKNIPLDKFPGDKSALPEKFLKIGKIGAAYLIEQSGLKGFSVGGAKISDEHSNFLVNCNKATQSDVLKVVEKVKREVYNKFGVELEAEVQIIY